MSDFPVGFAQEPLRLHYIDERHHVPSFYRRFGKRSFDLIVCLLLFPVLLSALPLICIAIKLDGGPIFYGHRRIGRGGRAFTCWKFRTMVVNGDQVLAHHLIRHPEAAVEWATCHKLKDDPRITAIGRFLRKTSFDEMPQLFNIMCGEMSFIGPRPVVDQELAFYGKALPLYLSVRPGLSGLWQVSGRNNLSYDTRVLLDCLYATRVSLILDAKILLKTIIVIFKRNGW